jgi:hypothetical protein
MGRTGAASKTLVLENKVIAGERAGDEAHITTGFPGRGLVGVVDGSGERALGLRYAASRAIRASREVRTPNYSLNAHAPDQTSIRPRLLQCASDLTAPCQSDLNSERVFMSSRGPQALGLTSITASALSSTF